MSAVCVACSVNPPSGGRFDGGPDLTHGGHAEAGAGGAGGLPGAAGATGNPTGGMGGAPGMAGANQKATGGAGGTAGIAGQAGANGGAGGFSSGGAGGANAGGANAGGVGGANAGGAGGFAPGGAGGTAGDGGQCVATGGAGWHAFGMPLSAATGKVQDPALAVMPDGRPVVSWTEGAPFSPLTYTSVWDGCAWQRLGDPAYASSSALLVTPPGQIIRATVRPITTPLTRSWWSSAGTEPASKQWGIRFSRYTQMWARR